MSHENLDQGLVTIVFRYIIENDLVLIISPITGNPHVFEYEGMGPFMNWLKSGDWKKEPYGALHMDFRYGGNVNMVVGCAQNGMHVDFLGFTADEEIFEEQIKGFCEGYKGFERDVVFPAKKMKEAGSSDGEIERSLAARQMFDLPPIWDSNMVPE